MLRIAADLAVYAAGQVGNGLGPEEARRAVAAAADELEAVAAALRRLTRPDRLDPARRRARAADLAADGLTQEAIAARLGVARSTVWSDLRRAGWLYRLAGRAPGGPDNVRAAAGDDPHEALVDEYPHGLSGGPAGYAVLLHERHIGRQRPVGLDRPGLDRVAEDRGELEIDRLAGQVINAVGAHVPDCR
jgi:hypothetical protein